MNKRIYHGFKDWANVAAEYQADLGDEPTHVWAMYATPAYEGMSVVVFKRDGKWWHNVGSHCSCYGLEGQWEPGELDAALHLAATEENRRLVYVDSYGELPEATQEAFDAWLRHFAKPRKVRT